MVGILIWPGRLIKKTVDNYVTSREQKTDSYDFKDETDALRESAEREISESESPDSKKNNEKKSISESEAKKETDTKDKFSGFEPAAPQIDQKLN